MRRNQSPRRIAVVAAVVGLFAVGSAAVAAPTDDTSAPGDASPAAGLADTEGSRRATVTLVTGDVVDARLDGAGRVLSASLRSGDPDQPDHSGVVWQDGTQVFAVPDGAQALIDAGRLDPDLFNVSKLIEYGYDDARRDTLPVIVQYAGGRTPRSSVPGVRMGAALPSVGASAAQVDKAEAADAWSRLEPSARARAAGSVAKIWLDAVVKGSAVPDLGAPTVPLTGATEVHRRGIDGSGVKVAVLDTGYDVGHPDLEGRVTASKSFVYGQEVDDLNGHGTHTASTVAGTGVASDGRYAGMAPGADLIVGKVLDNSGSGATSGIIAGMQWAVAEGADVVSMSLGNDRAAACNSLDTQALEALSDEALFVVAAGNASRHGTVATPGCSPAALTVGAIDRSGVTAPFSSRGPAVGSPRAKPDLASQGVRVVAARAGGRGDQAYVATSGTSMATPHVAGGAALVLQSQPGLTPTQLKDVLTSSASSTDTPVLEQGAGPLDVARAVGGQVHAPSNTSLGDFSYPQSGLAPTTASITLTNRSDTAASLDLALDEALGDDGKTAVKGLVTLTKDSVVVPANGTVDVPLRIDPRVEVAAIAYGVVTSRMVATSAAGHRVVAPFSVHLEEPSADLTISAVDRHGDAAASPSTFQLFDEHRDTARRYTIGFPSAGSTTIRVPHGTYAVTGTVMTRDEPGNIGSVASLAHLHRPTVVVDGDTTVDLDARDAEEITWRTDQPTEAAGFSMGQSYELTDDGAVKAGFIQTIPMLTKAIYAEPVRDDRVAFEATGRFSAPRLTLTSSGGRTVDDLAAQNGPEFAGPGSAGLVHVGKGTDANFAAHDIAGKVVLVDAGVGGGNAVGWSRAAVKGGAVGVLAASPGTVGRFQISGTGTTVPVVTVTWPDSQALQGELAQGPVTMSWTGTPLASSPYLYNLARYHTDAVVPGEERVKDVDLARVEAAYATQTGERSYLSDVMISIPGMAAQYAGGTSLTIAAPLRRTEFFTGDPQVAWTTAVTRGMGFTFGTSFDGPRTMAPGSRERTTWFRAPYGATLNTYGQPLMTRSANRLSFALAPYGDASGHDATADNRDRGTRQMLLDGEPQPQTSGMYVLPQRAADVAFRQTWSRPVSPFDQVGLGYSTEWRFRTSPEQQGAQPALVPVVDVPSDLANEVPSGGDGTRIPLSAVVDTAAGPVALSEVTLDYAMGAQSRVEELTDWKQARVQRTAKGWFAIVPADAEPGTFVHLRVSMADGQGSSVTQTMVRAYRLGVPQS